MIIKVVYYTFFILSAIILICIDLLALLAITVCLYNLFSTGYTREDIYSIIILCTIILGVVFLFMLILFFIFKTTRKMLKK